MPIPQDYAERVYAGVLGKLIGVYLGRPIEGWTYDRITTELGEITYYVPRAGVPLVMTDDDISGTFTFLRALPDQGNDRALTPAQVGETWLNYIIEGRTILWWGGLGNSTEHTAYLRLKHGVPAPASGSIGLNGRTVAEQIGSQIFIDGWAMVAPGDPELAADLARRAASVSHDGEAIYGAQVVAAMEAQAFVEPDLDRLIDTALEFIPADSIIARLIADIREWHAAEPDDWRATRRRIATHYGYDTFGGNCHMVPNHALIIHSLLHGQGDFQRSLTIVNTSGWDTDCNSGNVGCLLGIRGGLAALDAGPDWRGPVADRLYLPTADGGRAITDAVAETFRIVNIGRALAGEAPIAPKGGARFHFDLPGAVQGFQPDADAASATVENVAGHGADGHRSLAIRFRGVAPGHPARATTPTFVPPEAIAMPGYELLASPTLYPGQTVRARIAAGAANPAPCTVRLVVRTYGADDALRLTPGPATTLAPAEARSVAWRVPDMGGEPIAEVGVEVDAGAPLDGVVYLDTLTWDGTPTTTLGRPAAGGTMWRRAWVNGVDQYEGRWPEPYRVIQNEGTGLLIQGARQWTDYRASATVTLRLARAAGLGVRVQGLRRYYALLLVDDGTVRLVKARHGETILAERAFPWDLDRPYHLALEATGPRLRAWIDDEPLFDVEDADQPLAGGAVALVCTEGCLSSEAVTIRAAT